MQLCERQSLPIARPLQALAMPATQGDEASRQTGKAENRMNCRFPKVV